MIAKLSGSSAQKYYYEKDPLFNQNGDGENLAWGGSMASSLSLNGKVDKDDFKAVLDGKTKDGESLRYTSQKTSGEDRKAFDLVLSAPKSVSHAALVLDKQDIIKAHNQAVKETMKYAESLAEARVYNDKKERVKESTGKLLYASATHSTSRATKGNLNDPSLHTHNVIMNTTQTKDGKFVSLNVDKLYQNQALINKTYKENLAHNLKKAGYSVDYDNKGNFEISGYTKDVLENFSKRKLEIDSQAKLMKEDEKYSGKSDKELRDYAQHNFKEDKKDITKEELKKDWDRQHKENGIMSKADLEKAIKEASKDKIEKLSVEEVLKVAAENLTDKESHFDREKLLKEALRVNRGDNKVSDIEAKIDSVKKTGQKEDWELKKIEVNGEVRFTTKEIYDIEKENRKILAKKENSAALLSKEEANKGLDSYEEKKGWKMTETQRLAAFTALTTTDKYSSVQGDAGTGKTTFLDAVRHSLEFNNQNSSKLGVLAPTGKAAVGAEAESGIKSKTVDSYLMKGSFENQKDINNSFNKIFEDKKFQVGGGVFGLAFNKNNQITTVSQNKHYDKMTQSYHHTKTEIVKNGEYKGATRKTKLEIHGDTKSFKSDIKLADGREMKSHSVEWNMFKNLKTDSILSNKSVSYENKEKDSIKKTNKNEFKILGFSRKTESVKVYDEKGKLQETKATSEISFFGKTFGKETKADKDNIHNRNYVKDGDNFKSSKEQSLKNNSSLSSVDNKLDKSLKNDLNNSSDKKMVFVDEASMLSSKKLNSLLKDAEEKGHKIMFIGDTKQLSSVQQGKAFNEIQEITKTTSMNQGMRQRGADEDTKKVVDSFAKKDVKTALDTLEKQGKFKEMSSKEQKDYIVDKITKDDAYKQTAVLVATTKEANEINQKTREKLFGDKNFGTKVKVLEDKKLDIVDKMNTKNYEKGDKVSMKVKTKDGKERFGVYEIKSVDDKKGTINLGSDKKEFSLDLRKDSKNITNVSKVVEKSFAKGDKVINLKNDKQKGVMNGEIGYVKNIDEKTGKIEVEFGKKSVSYDKNEDKNLNHSYAMTVHKSQGITEEKTIGVLNSENRGMNKQNSAYVMASRHKEDFVLLTDNKKEIRNQIQEEQKKDSTTDSKESKEELKKELKEKESGIFEDSKDASKEEQKKDSTTDSKESKEELKKELKGKESGVFEDSKDTSKEEQKKDSTTDSKESKEDFKKEDFKAFEEDSSKDASKNNSKDSGILN